MVKKLGHDVTYFDPTLVGKPKPKKKEKINLRRKQLQKRLLKRSQAIICSSNINIRMENTYP